jgi:hypothetical protein
MAEWRGKCFKFTKKIMQDINQSIQNAEETLIVVYNHEVSINILGNGNLSLFACNSYL